MAPVSNPDKDTMDAPNSGERLSPVQHQTSGPRGGRQTGLELANIIATMTVPAASDRRAMWI